MAVFRNKKLMEDLFGELWLKMIHETEFGPSIKNDDISILFIIHDPEVVMFVDGDGVRFGAEAEKKDALVTMKMSGDIVHQFWLQNLNVPNAMALRHIRARGPVTQVLKLLPMLKPGQAFYPGYCAKFNLPLE